MGANSQDEMTEEIAALTPGGSSVMDIELGYGTKLWDKDLRHLLRAPKQLEKFKYRMGNTWYIKFYYGHFAIPKPIGL